MQKEDMKQVLDELDYFIRRFVGRKGTIYLYDTFSNREFVEFANSLEEYRHIKLIIEDGEIPKSEIRMNEIDYIISLKKEKEGV